MMVNQGYSPVKSLELSFCCNQDQTKWHTQHSEESVLEAHQESMEVRKADVHTVSWVARTMTEEDMSGEGDRTEWSLAARSRFHKASSVA